MTVLEGVLVGGSGQVGVGWTPIFDFDYHRVRVEFIELAYNQAMNDGYSVALPAISPTVRQFTLYFETMRYFLNEDGSLDLNTQPAFNMGRLEQWYRLFKLTTSFLYKHPAFGPIWVRFNNSIQVPKGLEAGLGWLEPFAITLVELPLNLLRLNSARSFGADDFKFPFHLVEHRYLPLSTVLPLGGGYAFAVRPPQAEQRVFLLTFKTLQLLVDEDGRLDITANPELNAGRLVAFYDTFKLHVPFTYQHPVYGSIKVRFNRALSLPEGIARGNGYLPPVEVELIEVL